MSCDIKKFNITVEYTMLLMLNIIKIHSTLNVECHEVGYFTVRTNNNFSRDSIFIS